ncbi:hypothetical protein AAGG74_17845 [Bacillus mexicanus]|uniref:hypothetical protein n=1 Tax=Bacillus mexicanus TaxID=2834415 RepID=UPI003D194546
MRFSAEQLQRFAEQNKDSELISGLIGDINELVLALKYSHRFAKRDSSYDKPFVEEVLANYPANYPRNISADK